MANRLTALFLACLAVAIPASAKAKDIYNLDIFDEVVNAQPEYEELKYYGIQTGMYYGYQDEIVKINHTLEKRSDDLDKVYNFRNLLINGNMLPPVIVKGKGMMTRESDREFKESSFIYRIRKQARISFHSITWREYIYMDVAEVDRPILNPGLKPKNSEEKRIWKESIDIGYNRGIQHARDIRDYKFAELNEDFSGMMLAYKLHDLNMISFSKLKQVRRGTLVTEDAININETAISIEGTDSFVPHSDWKPMIRVSEGDLDE